MSRPEFRPPKDPLGTRLVLRPILTPTELRFVDEYLIDLNPAGAAARAGLATSAGERLLATKSVQAAIQTAASRRGTRVQIWSDEVLRRWWLLAGADAREISEVWLVNCRHCWGIDHQYQFDDVELRTAITMHRKEQMLITDVTQRVEFDDLGGGGFDPYADPCRGPKAAQRLRLKPNAETDCPRCAGLGIKHIHIHDSRHYSLGAAYLYDGVKVGKDGSIHIQVRDRDAAMDKVAIHLGMMPKNNNINSALEDPTGLTNDQLETFIAQLKLLGVQPKTIEHEPTASDITEESSATTG